MAAVFDIELHDEDGKTQEDSDDDNTIDVEEVYRTICYTNNSNMYSLCFRDFGCIRVDHRSTIAVVPRIVLNGLTSFFHCFDIYKRLVFFDHVWLIIGLFYESNFRPVGELPFITLRVKRWFTIERRSSI